MILLIQQAEKIPQRNRKNLNSIMILLIPIEPLQLAIIPFKFKFHYDSINSLMPADLFVMKHDRFKFHYDSINSSLNALLNSDNIYLNSIMILLILCIIPSKVSFIDI